MAEWNPKWLAFLATKGMVPADADKLNRSDRISLNADFMCWNMRNADEAHHRSRR